MRTDFNIRGLAPVSPSQFMSSWRTHITKVLVFTLGKGPVPYPDELLWFGFPGTDGVAYWVTQDYRLVISFGFQQVDYQYLVWLRNE